MRICSPVVAMDELLDVSARLYSHTLPQPPQITVSCKLLLMSTPFYWCIQFAVHCIKWKTRLSQHTTLRFCPACHALIKWICWKGTVRETIEWQLNRPVTRLHIVTWVWRFRISCLGWPGLNLADIVYTMRSLIKRALLWATRVGVFWASRTFFVALSLSRCSWVTSQGSSQIAS